VPDAADGRGHQEDDDSLVYSPFSIDGDSYDGDSGGLEISGGFTSPIDLSPFARSPGDCYEGRDDDLEEADPNREVAIADALPDVAAPSSSPVSALDLVPAPQYCLRPPLPPSALAQLRRLPPPPRPPRLPPSPSIPARRNAGNSGSGGGGYVRRGSDGVSWGRLPCSAPPSHREETPGRFWPNLLRRKGNVWTDPSGGADADRSLDSAGSGARDGCFCFWRSPLPATRR
jgi:hypothetical protein